MGEIGGRMADLSIITADNSRFEKVEDILADIRGSIEKTGGAFLEIPDRREAIEYSITHSEPGDMIAIIGKGHENYQEIEGVRYPFLDRAVVEEVVSNRWQTSVRRGEPDAFPYQHELEGDGGSRSLCPVDRRES